MAQNLRKIAILTGELIPPSDGPSVNIARAFAALKDMAETQSAWTGAPLHFTRQRGDGWQVALERPEFALRASLAFRATLRATGDFDSYIGIAEGQVSGDIGPDLNLETSEAFVGSGTALDYAKGTPNKRFAYNAKVEMEALTTLVDHISAGWSEAQAAAALPFLSPFSLPNYTAVAKSLGKSRQAVTKAVEAAHLAPLSYALLCVEEA